jgi:formyltetrahydrofolate-dependent phosphoribosylglycinamide formyltransferase
MKHKIAILASTNATSSQKLIDEVKAGKFDAELFFIVNKADAGAVKRAEENGIPCVIVASKGRTKEEFENDLLEELKKFGAELILAIGFMKILSPEFVRRYPHKIMNIHPSLLPEFAGGMDMDVHAEVLKAGKKKTGCTLHWIEEGVDTGEIIAQKEVPVMPNDTTETLKARVQNAEKELILQEAKKFFGKK